MKEGYPKRSGVSRGRGFMNLSQELMVYPRSLRDPNKFYQELKVEPWSSVEEIKKSYKKLCRRYHPDGTLPDLERFLTISQAYDVLLHHREEYDSLPEGYRWRTPEDEVVGTECIDTVGDFSEPDPGFYSYYYMYGECDELASEWYSKLQSTLPSWGYRGRVALKLGESVDAHGRLVEVPYRPPTPASLLLVSLQLVSKSFR